MGKKHKKVAAYDDDFEREVTRRRQAIKATMRIGFIMDASPEVAEDILTLADDIARHTGSPDDFGDIVDRVSYNVWHYVRDERTFY